MGAPTPDLAGFADAQERLREGFGEDVTLLYEPQVTFPPGTPTDPETGQPYDPSVRPTASAQAASAIRANVTFKAINRAGIGGESDEGALGIMDTGHVMLIADLAASAAASAAVEFDARGERWKVTDVTEDGVGALQRTLIFGRKR